MRPRGERHGAERSSWHRGQEDGQRGRGPSTAPPIPVCAPAASHPPTAPPATRCTKQTLKRQSLSHVVPRPQLCFSCSSSCLKQQPATRPPLKPNSTYELLTPRLGASDRRDPGPGCPERPCVPPPWPGWTGLQQPAPAEGVPARGRKVPSIQASMCWFNAVFLVPPQGIGAQFSLLSQPLPGLANALSCRGVPAEFGPVPCATRWLCGKNPSSYSETEQSFQQITVSFTVLSRVSY